MASLLASSILRYLCMMEQVTRYGQNSEDDAYRFLNEIEEQIMKDDDACGTCNSASMHVMTVYANTMDF